MAIYSMTGFGRAEVHYNNKKIAIEIRALNSKQLDLNMRMPHIYRVKEMDLRTLVGQELRRGKVDIQINVEETGEQTLSAINVAAFKQYFTGIKQITEEMGIDTTHECLVSSVLRLPEVMEIPKNELDPEEWIFVVQALKEALSNFSNFRLQEGKALTEDILSRVQLIEAGVAAVCPFEEARIKNFKAKIENDLKELIAEVNIDKNRLEQELIYYLEKLDITEEKVRLRQHCAYFHEVVQTEEAPGRKLGFIAQELGREINTMGSKANEANIQKIVIGMKDELEKIKEQLLNIL